MSVTSSNTAALSRPSLNVPAAGPVPAQPSGSSTLHLLLTIIIFPYRD